MKVINIFLVAAILTSFSLAYPSAQTNSNNSNQEKDDEIFTISPKPQKAKIKSKPEARYPEEAKGYEARAIVKLRAVLNATGVVTNIGKLSVRIMGGAPPELSDAFLREAIEAAEKIEFEPARKDGRPVSQYVVLEYHFAP